MPPAATHEARLAVPRSTAPVNVYTIARMVGVAVGFVAGAALVCCVLALARREPWEPFGLAAAIGGLGSLALLVPSRREAFVLDHRSAFLAVSLSCVVACALGAVPFALHPAIEPGFVGALFESVSGLTTTGATILSGLDRLPRSLLLWRALLHGLGGMAVVLIGVAVLPMLGLGGTPTFEAESLGPSKPKLTPRLAETARVLGVLYVGLIALAGMLLWLAGMSGFDAICHAISTSATGAFSTHDRSVGFYDTTLIRTVTTVLMLAGGTSFAILHRALTGGISWRESPLLRAYLAIFLLASVAIAIDLRVSASDAYPTIGAAIGHATFQAASILSTTGLTTRDYELWPPLAHTVLLALCCVGGMSGSTAGGVKVMRIVLVTKLAFAQFFRLVHPRGIQTLKLGGLAVEPRTMLGVLGFLAMWAIVLGVGVLLLTLADTDFFTAVSAAIAALTNIGPGFAGVGPAKTYVDLAPQALLTLCGLMILGRLEIFVVLVVLTPGFWRD